MKIGIRSEIWNNNEKIKLIFEKYIIFNTFALAIIFIQSLFTTNWLSFGVTTPLILFNYIIYASKSKYNKQQYDNKRETI